MNILIIEDEKPARKRLKNMLREYSEPVTLVGELATVSESVQWLAGRDAPDLILIDIQLTDGSAFEIFEQIKITCPVIFITAFDQYLSKSFKHNGIDYLLKPITRENLFDALDRYDQYEAHFTGRIADIFRDIQTYNKNFISRLLVQSRDDFYSINTEDIAYCTSKHKITTVTSIRAEKFTIDRSLSSLELHLNPNQFFRLNRNYLSHINAVESFQQYFRGKLIVKLQPDPGEKVIVSQAKAGEFRNFMEK